jgi:hypothetical protein
VGDKIAALLLVWLTVLCCGFRFEACIFTLVSCLFSLGGYFGETMTESARSTPPSESPGQRG